MTGPELRQLLEDGRVHLMDGAMGTMLYTRGVFVNVCYDELNLREPDIVRDVHAAYVAAGAEMLETNTFGANPVKLSSWGLEDRTEEINAVAARIAREAALDQAAVVGAIGPLGVRIEPWGPTSRDEARAFFRRQAEGLLDGGVSGFVLETFSDLSELEMAYRAVREASDLPVIAQITVGDDGATSYGTLPEVAARSMADWGPDVIGLNCSVGPAIILDALERMSDATQVPLSAQPNAGLPRTVAGRMMYMASPEYMAQYARRLIEAGARIVGGCCGTTPEHIRGMHETLASLQPSPPVGPVSVSSRSEPRAVPRATPLGERSRLGRKLAGGEFVTSVELIPPRGWNGRALVEAAERLHREGVDLAAILDSPLAQGRMSAIPAALLVEGHVDIEPLVHYACRNRNMIGMVSDLLGAAAGGLRNVLVVTGDPPREGPYGQARAAYDIDSIGLTNVVRRLNEGLDPGGGSIGEPTRFVIGVALNQGARDLEAELERFVYKVEAGAHFAVTQPVFDAAELSRFLDRSQDRSIPVIAGVWPLTSARNAEFLGNEVPGVRVPHSVVARMSRAEKGGPEAARAEGMRIASEVVAEVRPMVQGIHVSGPGRPRAALDLLHAAGLLPQPARRVGPP